MLLLKQGVRFNVMHFRPHIARMWYATLLHAPETVGRAVVATSLNDGRHMNGSKHYTDEAGDFRGQGSNLSMPGTIVADSEEQRKIKGLAWAERVRDELGQDYDVLFEDKIVTVKGVRYRIMHLHEEWDPKGG